MGTTRHRFFVSVTPGLEGILESELARLVDGEPHRVPGGVELAGSTEDLWRICRQSALAEGLRLRVGRSALTRSFDELEAALAKLPFHAFLRRGGPLPQLRVVCKRSRLYHSEAVAERAEGVLRARLGCVDEAERDQMVHLRLLRDRVQVSVDASGEALHRRGYRAHIGAAPLRETLAAALLALAGYKGQAPLWDPFCGSGTILIEAARALRGVAPGGQRRFAFEGWPTHDAAAYADFCATSEAGGSARGTPPIIGSDHDEQVLKAAKRNTHRGRVSKAIRLEHGDFERVLDEIPEGAFIVSNPPYGHRMRPVDLTRIFRRLGRALSRRRDLGPVLLMDGSGRIPELTGLPWRELAKIDNRGLPVRVLELERKAD